MTTGQPCGQDAACGRPAHLHIVVLDVVVGQRLQERLGVVAQGAPVGAEAGLAGGGAPGGAAVVLVLLFIVAVVDLAGLQAS